MIGDLSGAVEDLMEILNAVVHIKDASLLLVVARKRVVT